MRTVSLNQFHRASQHYLVVLILLSLGAVVVRAQEPYTTWRHFNGSLDSSNYSALKQIDRFNVSKLEVAWSYPTGNKALHAMNPIVVDRTLYLFAKNGSLVAVDAGSGREIWTHPLPKGASSTRQRGMSYWESKDRKDRRIFIAWGLYLHAINANNGELIEEFGAGGRVDLREGLGRDPQTVRSISSGGPGRVFENLIIMGSSTGEAYVSPPGDIRAYDVRTGKIVWTFHTIPRPGEYGYDTWPKDAWKYAGAANNWGDMTVDEKRGIVYIPTGSPTYDFWGGDRKGNNLFGNCLLALDARTGKRLWHFQTVHHDLSDYDNVSAPQLVTVRHEGKTVDAVALAGKTGFLYVFDRVTGKPLWPIEERPVPRSNAPGEFDSPTQPFPTKPPPFARQRFTVDDLNPYLPENEKAKWRKFILEARNDGLFTPAGLDRYTIQMPGHSGGAALFSPSADPATGTVYVVSFDGPAVIRLEATPATGRSSGRPRPPLVPGLPGCETYGCSELEGSFRSMMSADPAALNVSSKSGRTIYEQNCQACHGSQLGGTGAVPSLRDVTQRLNESAIRATVQQGLGQMPGFALSDSSLDDLLVYLRMAGFSSRPSEEPPYPADVKEVPKQRYYSAFGPSPGIITPPWSTLTAYDLNLGTIKWQIPYGSSVGVGPKDNNNGIIRIHGSKSSVAVTAGGLLFSATVDRKFRAYDKDTGKVIWSTNLPDMAIGIPTIYELDGRQYVVISTRGGILAYALPKEAGASKQKS